MKPITERTTGQLYERDGNTALLLDESANPVYLRYALLVQGTAERIFPAVLLDDWGRERSSLSLYRWIYEEGQRYPRAEIFGFDASGRDTQIFLRDLEIYFRYPCYAYQSRKTGVERGRQLQTVLVADQTLKRTSQEAQPPGGASWPLRRAAITWQRINPDALLDLGYRLLTGEG